MQTTHDIVPMPVVLSGDLGAGKTTLRKRLAAALGWEEFYAGNWWRTKAREANVLIEEYYRSYATPEMERELDAHQEHLIKTTNALVIEGRVAPFLAPSVEKIKVYIAVSEAEGARRQQQRPENAGFTVEQIVARARERTETERQRYRSLYGIEDHLDRGHFDIVIETDGKTADEAFEQLLSAIREKITPH